MQRGKGVAISESSLISNVTRWWTINKILALEVDRITLIHAIQQLPKPWALSGSCRKFESTMSKALVKLTLKTCPVRFHFWMLKINSSIVMMLSAIHLPFMMADCIGSISMLITPLNRFIIIFQMILREELIKLIGWKSAISITSDFLEIKTIFAQFIRSRLALLEWKSKHSRIRSTLMVD